VIQAIDPITRRPLLPAYPQFALTQLNEPKASERGRLTHPQR
jgi:hypothetical protein